MIFFRRSRVVIEVAVVMRMIRLGTAALRLPEHLGLAVTEHPLGGALNASMRPCESITITPSTAASMMARQRAPSIRNAAGLRIVLPLTHEVSLLRAACPLRPQPDRVREASSAAGKFP